MFQVADVEQAGIPTVSLVAWDLEDNGQAWVSVWVGVWWAALSSDYLLNCGQDGDCGTNWECDKSGNWDTWSCQQIPPAITDAYWSHTEVYEGTTVTLTALAEGLNGYTMNFDIYEHDLLFDEYVTTLYATVQNDSASTQWVAQWMEDGVGDPEYIFTA